MPKTLVLARERIGHMDPGAAVALTRRQMAELSRHVVAHASKLAREWKERRPGLAPSA